MFKLSISKKCAALAVSLLLATPALAIDGVDLSGSVGTASGYVFRGAEVTPNAVGIAGLRAEYGMLAITVDGTTLGTTKTAEVDTGLTVTVPVTRSLEVEFGAINYAYAGTNQRSSTDWLIGGIYTLGNVQVSSEAYRGAQTKDWWIDTTVAGSYAGVDLSVGADYAVYNSSQTIKNQFELVEAGVAYTQFLAGFELTMSLDASFPLNDRKIGGSVTANKWVGTITETF